MRRSDRGRKWQILTIFEARSNNFPQSPRRVIAIRSKSKLYGIAPLLGESRSPRCSQIRQMARLSDWGSVRHEKFSDSFLDEISRHRRAEELP
jgi:hypothetical protein